MNPELIGIIILAPILAIITYKNLFNSNNSTQSQNNITDPMTGPITGPINFWSKGKKITGGKSIKNKSIKNKSIKNKLIKNKSIKK